MLPTTEPQDIEDQKSQLTGQAYTITTVDTTNVESDVVNWLITNAGTSQFLLAHAENGIIWGRFEGGKLLTSHDAFCKQCQAMLKLSTLWQCRLFGPNDEVLLWHDDEGWHARCLQDRAIAELILDEEQMLWGTTIEGHNKGFTLLHDGSQGLRHAVPLVVQPQDFAKQARPLRLVVRHYLEEDPQTGVVRISLSRLVNVYV